MSRRDRQNAGVDAILEGNFRNGLPPSFVTKGVGRDVGRAARGAASWTGSTIRNKAADTAMAIGKSRPANGDPDSPPPLRSWGRKSKSASGDPLPRNTGGGGRGLIKRVLRGPEIVDLDAKNRRDAGLL